MQNQSMNSKVITATKWSGATELAAKLVSPVTTMALARILTPDAFGVLVTAQVVISFAEVFTDAGFQKYIIQHEFKDENEQSKSATVAFWSNLAFSLVVWGFIILFSSPIAEMVGCKGNGIVIAVSSVCIPLTAFSSIQMALYKRFFDFKTLFVTRIVGVSIPVVVTIPLALWTRSYWALIVGMIALNVSNAVVLTVKSKWKPCWYYSYNHFKQMFSFSLWSLVESVSIWLTCYMDLFIVGALLSQHYLGLYRTSMNTVAQITGFITAATTPVLFSSLSRLQNNEKEFQNVFFRFQKTVGILVIPAGVGIYIFRDFVTMVLLGSQWLETAEFIGMWGLSTSLTVVLAHYSSEVYRAKGKPKLSVLAQWLHIVVLYPAIYLSIGYGYDTLCIVRSVVRLESILAHLLVMCVFVHFNVVRMFSNIFPSLLASLSMFVVSVLPATDSLIMTIAYIFLAALLYMAVLMVFPDERHLCLNLHKIIKKRQ